MSRPRPRIIFVNRYAWPDEAATSQLLNDISLWLADKGWEVIVMAANQLYTDPKKRLPQTEDHQGVRMERLSTTRFGRNNLLGRAVDYLTFYAGISLKLLFYLRRGDVLVAKTDPPLLGVPLSLVASLRGAALMQWCQDLFPEIAFAPRARQSALWRALQAPLRWSRNLSFRLSERLIVLGEDMADFVKAQCPSAKERVSILQNWSDDQAIQPIAREDNPLRKAWGLDGAFVVGYSGNLGRVHEYETFLAAAQLLKNEDDIRFLFIGSGALRQKMEKDLPSELRPRFLFQPYQPRSELSHSLCVPDVHWLCLHPLYRDYVFPSKYYGILAAGRPMLFIGDAHSHLAQEIEAESLGYSIQTGDAETLAARIRSMKNNRESLLAMGYKARQHCEQHHLFTQRAAAWHTLLQSITQTIDAEPAKTTTIA